MATYTVTTSTWNDPAFWSSISETTAGHEINFFSMPSNFSIDFGASSGLVTISDGTTTFTIGDATYGGVSDATLGGTTQWDFFNMFTGNDGANRHSGTSNDDTLEGGQGQDTLSGGGGNDLIDGRMGDDSLDGGAGNDTILGDDGNDMILGGNGRDDLRGDAGNDTIQGGAGHDVIRGGAGDDSMIGGTGADTFMIENGFGQDTIEAGESGVIDVIDLSGVTGPVTVTFDGTEAGTISDGLDTLQFSQIEGFVGTGFNDFIDASLDHNGQSGDVEGVSVTAGDGNDTIFGGNGGDTILGEGGDDSIAGNYGDDSLFGGAGADVLSGGLGNDSIDGGAGNDSIEGGAEGDTLRGGAGDDIITGGAGDDVFVYTVGDGLDTITDFNFGNTGALGDGNTTNNDFIDLSTFYDDMGELQADWADDFILNQSNTTGDGAADYSNNAQFVSGEGITFDGASQSSFTTDNTGVTCFTLGTAIRTPSGEVLIEDLRVGDLVSTLDNGPQRLRWIGRRTISGAEMATQPNLRPVRIQRGVLGNARKMLVSRQHGMLVGGDHLARAAHLGKALKGVGVPHRCAEITYVHLMFERHEIVFAQGVPSESFYPGPQAMRVMGADQMAQMKALLPELNTCTPSLRNARLAYGPVAREFLGRRQVMGWAGRAAPELALAG